MSVFVSVNHGDMSSGVHGSPLAWAESVSSNGFQACMVEHGAGSAGNATIDWVAYQGRERGVAHGKERFNRFTSGVQCRDINIPQVSKTYLLNSSYNRQENSCDLKYVRRCHCFF